MYSNKEKDFDNNGIVVLNECKSFFTTEKLNGEYEVEFEYPIDLQGKWSYIVEDNIVKNSEGQLFRIYNKVKTLIGIRANARHIFYDLLDNFLEDVRPTNTTGVDALDWVLTHTQYPHRFISTGNVEGNKTRYFIRKNVVEAIMGEDGIINTWGGELVRDNFSIKLLQERGTDRGVLVSYGKNIKGIEESIDIDGICTRLMPKGKDGLLITEKYIDSPYIDKFSHPKIKMVEFSEIEEEDELRKAAKEYMINNKIDIPIANYKIDFVELSKTEEYKNYSILEKVDIGDIVTIRHTRLGIDLKAKVIGIKKNDLNKRIEKIELGSFKDNIANSINNSIQEVKKEIENNKNVLEDAIGRATDKINNTLGGYVIKRNGELLIMDTEDIYTASKVWRWNKGGLGYSSNGYNGPYKTAITQDGEIVADFVTTGVLNAVLIKAGVLKSFNGTSWLNMEDGTFNLANKIKFDGTNFTIDLSEENLATNEQVKSIVDMNANAILAKVSNSNKLIAKNTILTGDFTSSTGGVTSANWTRNTISLILSTYSTDGTNWCNFYTTNTVGELFAYQDVTVEVGKPYEFSCKIAKYSSASQYYCIRIQEYINSTWVTKKEFTGIVNVDRSNPLVLYTKYKPTTTQARIWIGKTDGNKFDIYATDFQLFYTTDVVKSAELKVLEDEIETKVSESDVGTVIQQNAYAVKIAWNKISNYVQFENGGLSIYNGAVTTSQKRAVFDESGNHFWRDGYYLGKIGTNQYSGDSSIKGIVFDLEAAGGYMTWAIKKYSTSSTYSMMWTYANKTVGSYSSGKLHAGCDIDMHNYYLRNVNFEGGGINGTLIFTQIVGMNTNGTAARWYNNSKLVFQNGILIDATWGSA